MEMAYAVDSAADCATQGNILMNHLVLLVLNTAPRSRVLSILVPANATKVTQLWREGAVLLVSVVLTRAFLGLLRVNRVSHIAHHHTHPLNQKTAYVMLAFLVLRLVVICVLQESTDLEDQVRASIAGFVISMVINLSLIHI